MIEKSDFEEKNFATFGFRSTGLFIQFHSVPEIHPQQESDCRTPLKAYNGDLVRHDRQLKGVAPINSELLSVDWLLLPKRAGTGKFTSRDESCAENSNCFIRQNSVSAPFRSLETPSHASPDLISTPKKEQRITGLACGQDHIFARAPATTTIPDTTIMNDLEPTPIDGHHLGYSEEQSTNLFSPTPIGPNAIMGVTNVVSATSLFDAMDHTTTKFLKEMFCTPRGRMYLPAHAFLLDPSCPPPSSSSPSCTTEEGVRNLKKLSFFVENDDNDSRDGLPKGMQSNRVSTRVMVNCICDPVSSDFSMSSEEAMDQEDGGGRGGGAGELLPMKSHWSEKFGELVAFKRRFGHCLVPNNWNENIKLSQWVKRQRHQYKIKKEGKNSSLSNEKIYALEALGFTWSVQEDTWEERFNELVEYKRLYGHTNVPKNCKRHPRLSVWVKYQRRHLRLYMSGERSSMTEERFYKLTKLGFQWNPRKEKLNSMAL